MTDFPGKGRKRPQEDISYTQLYLDPENPRLPERFQNKPEQELIKFMRKAYYLDELAQSMSVNGYLDEEPLVAIPNNLPTELANKSEAELKDDSSYMEFIRNEETTFTVVEGNRRLSTVKLLLQGDFSKYQPLDEEIEDDLQILPVIIYPKRDTVLSYLGVRHINPVRKWSAYAKARYIAKMIETDGQTVDLVQKRIGDTSNSARKTYACYKLIELMEDEFDYKSEEAKENFSFLILASGQGSIKRYLGLPERWQEADFDNLVRKEDLKKVKRFFQWIYGDVDKRPIISESRDITKKLTPILNRDSSTKYLEDNNDLDGAYERSDGDELLLNNYLANALNSLEKSLILALDKGIKEDAQVYLKKIEKRLDSLKNF